MNCDRAQAVLSARLDGERAPERVGAAVDAHAATCPRCRAFEAGALRVRTSVRVRPAEPVPDLVGSIMTRVAAEAGARPGRMTPAPAALARAGVGAAGSRRCSRRRSPASWPEAWSSAGRGSGRRTHRSPLPRSWRACRRPRRRSTRSRRRSPSPNTDCRPTCRSGGCGWTWRSSRRSASVWTSTTRPPTRRPVGRRRTSRSSPTARRRIARGPPGVLPTCPPAGARPPARPSPLAPPIRCARRRRPTWCCRSRRSRRPTASRCSGRIASRDATRSGCDSRSPGHRRCSRSCNSAGPGARSSTTTAWISWLDASGWFPLRYTVYPSTDPARVPWELRFGIAHEPTDEPIFDVRLSSLDPNAPDPATFEVPGWSSAPSVPLASFPRRVGYLPVTPDVAGRAHALVGGRAARRRPRRAELRPPVHGRHGVRADRGTPGLDRAEAVRSGGPGRAAGGPVGRQRRVLRAGGRRPGAATRDPRVDDERLPRVQPAPRPALDAGGVAARPRRSAPRRLANADRLGHLDRTGRAGRRAGALADRRRAAVDAPRRVRAGERTGGVERRRGRTPM